MLVSAKFDKSRHIWRITILEGSFEGETVAECDAITLKECVFDQDVILGHPKAVWGAILNPELILDINTLKDLGINRPFQNTGGYRAEFDGEKFVDQNTRRTLKTAKYVGLFRSGIQYRA